MPLWHLAHLCREEQHPSNNKKNMVVLASNAAWASLQSYGYLVQCTYIFLLPILTCVLDR
eukprot:scaffold3686_cov106-Skeletonema_dohrnii-CCMP3373.AAC.5